MAQQQTVQQVMDFLKSHPEAARKAADYLRAHPEEVKEALRDVAERIRPHHGFKRWSNPSAFLGALG